MTPKREKSRSKAAASKACIWASPQTKVEIRDVAGALASQIQHGLGNIGSENPSFASDRRGEILTGMAAAAAYIEYLFTGLDGCVRDRRVSDALQLVVDEGV